LGKFWGTEFVGNLYFKHLVNALGEGKKLKEFISQFPGHRIVFIGEGSRIPMEMSKIMARSIGLKPDNINWLGISTVHEPELIKRLIIQKGLHRGAVPILLVDTFWSTGNTFSRVHNCIQELNPKVVIKESRNEPMGANDRGRPAFDFEAIRLGWPRGAGAATLSETNAIKVRLLTEKPTRKGGTRVVRKMMELPESEIGLLKRNQFMVVREAYLQAAEELAQQPKKQ
jgi:hypothetical protein